MQHPLRTWGGIILFGSAAVDVIAKTAGLYADGPGLFNGLLSLGKRVMSHVTVETAVMVVGLMLVGWGLFGDRIKAIVRRKAAPGGEDVAALPSEWESRILTAETWFQGYERRLMATTKLAEDGGERIGVAERRIAAIDDHLLGVESRIKEIQLALRSLAGRAIELKIDDLLANRPDLPPYVMDNDLSIRGRTHEAQMFMDRVHELSQEWHALGPSPYERFLNDAHAHAQIEFDKLLNAGGINHIDQPSEVRLYIIAHFQLKFTKDYLDLRRSTARNLQMDFVRPIFIQ